MAGSMPSFLATDAQAYEHFMARWSQRLAGPFLDFAAVKAGDRVLDVGCGTGVITAVLADRGCTVIGLDASEPYLEGARRKRSHRNIVYELGDARRMPYPDASFDACVSALAIDVIPEVDQVVREMRRVTRGGGTVASSVCDFWGGFSPADLVCDTASVLDEGMRSLRDQRKARPIVWANGQAAIWRETGLLDVVEVPIVISFDYASFKDYWSSFSTAPSPIGQRVAALPAEVRAESSGTSAAGIWPGCPTGRGRSPLSLVWCGALCRAAAKRRPPGSFARSARGGVRAKRMTGCWTSEPIGLAAANDSCGGIFAHMPRRQPPAAERH